jgi:hypothetical protein
MNATIQNVSDKVTTHDKSVESVAEIARNSGWVVDFDPKVNTPSGTPVHADLSLKKPNGGVIYVECKIGDKDAYLPISGFAQAAQLASSGVTTVLCTNMKLAPSVSKLFEGSNIHVLDFSPALDEKALTRYFEQAVSADPGRGSLL